MAISLSQIQSTEGGSSPIKMSEYYRGGAYMPSNYTWSNYSVALNGKRADSTVPTSGKISLSQITPTNKAVRYPNGSGSPLTTGYGSSVTSSNYSLANIIPSSKLATGKRVYLTFYTTGSWARYPHITTSIVIGTAKTVKAPNPGGKVYNSELIYDGGVNIKLRGYYSGPGTKFPNGQVWLEGVGAT